ncbi:MAG: chemotaxis protein CheW [Sulfuricurvum sp.]|nr:chemotaxis protein CheW [Sulfuricurvum sp.]
MKIEEILIVQHDKVSFGIPTYLIGQILRIPEITPLVLSPAEVYGVCAVGGNIITAVDMPFLLGMNKVDIFSQQSRILTLSGAWDTIGLVVSEVVSSVIIIPEALETIHNPYDSIMAIYHHEDELIQIVDVEKLLSLIHKIQVESKTVNEKNSVEKIISERNDTNSRYLIFRMGSESYGLSIDYLREILGSSRAITPISGLDDEVIGMMSLRDELVLVIDLRMRYGFHSDASDKNRILITQLGPKVVGLMIDEIIDIKEYADAQIERFTEARDDSNLAGVIHDGENLISLIGRETIDEVMNQYDELIISSEASSTVTEKSDVVCEVVVFKLGSEEYAIAIERVAEIIDVTPITPIAESPETLEGVVNIRGQIITIGSLYRQLHVPPASEAEQKIIICDTPQGKMGFFVDGVSDVLAVYQHELHEERDVYGLYSHVLHFNEGKRLVLLLDLERAYGKEGK